MKELIRAEPMEKDEESMPKCDEGKTIDSYRLESAMRTLEEAEEIKKNKKLMSALKPHVSKRQDTVASIADLVKKRDRLRKAGR